MKITKQKKIEDCFDGSRVFRYWFNECWEYHHIMTLKKWGSLEYFAHFPKPFFRVFNDKGFYLKGVQGEMHCQVIYPSKEMHLLKKQFENSFA